jgi:hypothetical protein
MGNRSRIAVGIVACVVGLALFGLGGAVAAGPADFVKLAPAEHEVFIYCDIAQMRKSKLFNDLKPTIFDQDTSTRLAAVEQFIGVNLLNDIDIVAASGKIAQQNDGCLYITGRWDRQRIEGLFAQNPAYAEVNKPGGKIIRFRDDRKGTINSLTFLNNNLAVIGDSSAVEAAQAASAGQGKTLAENPAIKAHLAQCGANPVALVVALRPQAMPANLTNVPTIQNLQSVLLYLLDGADALTVVARVQADSPQIAAKWLDIARGAIAVGQIQNKVPKLAEVANQSTAALNGNAVEVKTQIKVADAGEVLRQRIAQDRAQRPNLGGVRVRGGALGPGQVPGEKPVPAQW